MHNLLRWPFALALTGLVPVMPTRAQATLGARVAQARDGVVHVQVESRPGVCGDGRSLVGYRHAMFARDFSTIGRWSDQRCVAGPMRVSVSVSGGQVTQIQTQVGGAWPATSAPVTNLGDIAPREASAYFFSLVPRLESASAKERLLLPAVLADDAIVIAPLLAIARDAARSEQTRRQAVQWLGLLGDSSVVPALVAFANEASNEERGDKPGKKGVASTAVAALSYLEDNAGIPALIQLARHAPLGTRRNAVFWLGQNGDTRGLRVLRTVVEDTTEDTSVRKNAIFSLGTSDAVRTSDLVAVYQRVSTADLREHTIFVLSQRQDETSLIALMRIAREDSDTRMRGKALFWLAQRHDPRVTKLIGDLVLK